MASSLITKLTWLFIKALFLYPWPFVPYSKSMTTVPQIETSKPVFSVRNFQPPSVFSDKRIVVKLQNLTSVLVPDLFV